VADALAAACAEVGIDPDGARLLRMHSNTVFYLPASNAVARINTGPDGPNRVAASLTATRWLARQGFPTVRPKVDRPVIHDGVVVSFWEYEEIVQAGRSLTVLAELLRELHSCRPPPWACHPRRTRSWAPPVRWMTIQARSTETTATGWRARSAPAGTGGTRCGSPCPPG
jgi:hypothetical protein